MNPHNNTKEAGARGGAAATGDKKRRDMSLAKRKRSTVRSREVSGVKMEGDPDYGAGASVRAACNVFFRSRGMSAEWVRY